MPRSNLYSTLLSYYFISAVFNLTYYFVSNAAVIGLCCKQSSLNHCSFDWLVDWFRGLSINQSVNQSDNLFVNKFT